MLSDVWYLKPLVELLWGSFNNNTCLVLRLSDVSNLRKVFRALVFVVDFLGVVCVAASGATDDGEITFLFLGLIITYYDS